MKIPDFPLPEAPSRRGQIMVALRSAFPGYTFSVITGNDGPRYEAVSKTFGDPYCRFPLTPARYGRNWRGRCGWRRA